MTTLGPVASYPDQFVQALDSSEACSRIQQVRKLRLSFRGGELHADDRHRNEARALVDELHERWKISGEVDFSIIEHGSINAPDILPGIKPKSQGQRELLEAMSDNTIAFAVGPAGTGKTFLAIAHAVSSLKSGQVDRIVLTRPVVESGENLGFLPGSLEDKIDPYLRPLFDALKICMPGEDLENLTAREAAHPQRGKGGPKGGSKNGNGHQTPVSEAPASTRIEIAPLAYMRGRTLTRAVCVLDEAQNATPEQMKMFLTRLGHGSQLIITGDPHQSDLRGRNGLTDFLERYDKHTDDISGMCVIELGSEDIVRHWMVREVIKLYEPGEKA